MSQDARLRSAERSYQLSPDAASLRLLQSERIRAGLGWHGEALPEVSWGGTLRPGADPGVYRLVMEATEPVALEFVYVPGGEVECDNCQSTTGRMFDVAMGAPVSALCGRCNGTGKKLIAPFYVGRFPVTNEEWNTRLFVSSPPRDRRPATNVSHADALAFCEWAGLRLPTGAEWQWAALGGAIPSLDATSPAPWRVGVMYTRRYPWGNKEPTPDRCVWRDHPEFGPRSHEDHGGYGVDFSGSTAPVLDCAACVAETCYSPLHHNGFCRDGTRGLSTDPLVPARPRGASWCGAHDMCGNVWEWNEDRTALGGSFRTTFDPPFAHSVFNGAPMGWEPEARDDLGFRVALSATVT